MQKAGVTNNQEKSKEIRSFLTSFSAGKGAFLLYLADTNLILSHRISEWCGHGPILEQDIAITNISLDLLGQARNLYQYAARLINEAPLNLADPAEADQPWLGGLEGATEDSLAYLRTESAFKNLLITELPRGDWALTILRQFLFSAYQYELYQQLENGSDFQLAAIAEKSIKEMTYHIKWSSEWVIRLGNGTEESHKRMEKAIDTIWAYTGEFFIQEDYEKAIVDESVLATIKDAWQLKVSTILELATLQVPENTYMQTGGKSGNHTEHLGFILAEMQYLQRTYPGANW